MKWLLINPFQKLSVFINYNRLTINTTLCNPAPKKTLSKVNEKRKKTTPSTAIKNKWWLPLLSILGEKKKLKENINPLNVLLPFPSQKEENVRFNSFRILNIPGNELKAKQGRRQEVRYPKIKLSSIKVVGKSLNYTFKNVAGYRFPK